ncbi:hypothetical protein CXF85_13295 [Colwellia sp. 75C3]|uniref:two-component regulator propeller domain-containing protein n=1 Tax=Colwellia sp. 75C3 TaxID=888425 RepID=UPI000C3414A4|nr:two-component regulator propeller domain-containing protein [Colwellia sp. 75C3]PKG82459.1 hypothetical protein CXF85_13295 [Colwellia sp. 75C3]
MKFFYSLSIFFLVNLCFSQFSHAQLSNDLFSPVIYPAEANDRLENKSINELAQDDKGFIWVGTRRGLFRFDGYDYKKILFVSSKFDFSTIYVRALLVDGDTLWVGTMSDGMFRLNLNTYQVTQYINDDSNSSSIAGKQVNDFAIDNKGKLWIATNKGLETFDKQQTFSHYLSVEKPDEYYFNHLLDVEFDSQNRLWISSGKGLALFDEVKQGFSLFYQEKTAENNEQLFSNHTLLKNVIVRKIFIARDKRIWLATQKKGNYIIELDNIDQIESATVIKLPLDNPKQMKINTTIAQPSDNEIWISGFSGIEIRDSHSGALLKVLKSNLLDKYSLSNDFVNAMLVSQSGLIWLGVKDSGLHYFNQHNEGIKRVNTFLPQLKNIFDSYISQVIKLSKYEILVISKNKILRINLQAGDSHQLVGADFKEIGQITSAILTDDGAIFLGAKSGELFQYSQEKEELINVSISLSKTFTEGITLLAQSNTGVWIAQANRLHHLNLKKLKLESVINQDGSEFLAFIKSLTVDKNGQLWIGTNNGLGIITIDSLTIKIYSKELNTQGTLSNNYINQVIEDNDGNIFINTRSGINKLINQTGKQLQFTSFAQMATDKTPHDEMLFSSSDSTYWYGPRFHLSADGDILSEQDVADGLLNSQRGKSILAIGEERILFASSGLLIFEPKKITPWIFQPNIVATNITIGDKEVPFGVVKKGIHLAPADDEFSVRFSALDFTSPNNNDYRYKLEGYDDTWVETPTDVRQAKYTSLSPGTYTLLLDGSNRKGIWTNPPMRIKVIVEAKFYQTIWFRLAILMLFTFSLYLLFQWRLKAIRLSERKEHEKREAIQKAEMITELMEQKNRMLADVTHDLRTPLTTIKMQLEALEDGVLQHSEKSYNSLQKKLGNLNKMVGDLYQLSLVETGAFTLNKQDHVINHILLEAIESFQPLAKKAGLLLSFTSSTVKELEVNFDSDRLSQVFNNLLKNSIRYSDPQGCINVLLSVESENVVISFEDSSPGVEDKELPLLFDRSYQADATRNRSTNSSGLGLSIVSSIINAHDGKVTAQCSSLGGIKIVIMFPIIN